MPTISTTNARFTSGDYSIQNNDWGRGSLQINKDYTQQITYQTFANQDVTAQWNYPNYQSPSGVWGYPEVVWGNKLGNFGTTKYVAKVKDISDLSVDFAVDIAGETQNFNVRLRFGHHQRLGPLAQSGLLK